MRICPKAMKCKHLNCLHKKVHQDGKCNHSCIYENVKNCYFSDDIKHTMTIKEAIIIVIKERLLGNGEKA